MPFVVLTASLVAFLAASIAGPQSATGEASAEESDYQPQLAGDTDLVADGEYRAVAFVLFPGTGCTGSLIANEWVLTAAHCVPVGQESRGQVFLDQPDARVLQPEDALKVSRVEIHPDYRAESSSLLRIGHDLALLQLAQPVRNIAPLTLSPSSLAASHGTSATMVGYGDVCAGCGGDDRLRSGTTTFLGDRKNSSLARAFRQDLELVAFTESDDLTSQAGICSGDSGGPVLGEIDGYVGIVAVLSNEILLGEEGRTVACGGAGHSFGVHVEVAAGTPNANWIFSTIGDRPTCAGLFATIVGTGGSDVLRGTRGRDVIVGRAGNDRITGGAGRDILCGGPGDDTLRGEAGADVLRGGGGTDLLVGNAGKDRCTGDRTDRTAGCERVTVAGETAMQGP